MRVPLPPSGKSPRPAVSAPPRRSRAKRDIDNQNDTLYNGLNDDTQNVERGRRDGARPPMVQGCLIPPCVPVCNSLNDKEDAMTKRCALFIVFALLLVPAAAWADCPVPGDLANGTGKAFEHVNCGGWFVALGTSTNEADLRKFGGSQNINDMISSIVLGPGIKCEFYTDIKFKGSKIGPLTKGTYDMVKAGYNDKISSIKCYAP